MRRSTTYLCLLISLFLLLIIFPSNTLADDTQPTSTIKSIKVGIDDNYPPYCFRDGQGNLQGISVDQWRLWEKQTGTTVDLQGMDGNTCLNLAQQGKFDVVDTMLVTEERSKYFDYLKPYAKVEISIFYCENIPGIKDAKSVIKYSVAVKSGDPCLEELKKNGVTDIKQYDSYESIIQAAKAYKGEIFAMDLKPAFYYFNKIQLEERFNYTHPIYCGDFGRAVRKNDGEMLTFVQKGFDSIPKKEYERINNKWITSSFIEPELREFLWGGCGLTLLVIVGLLVWNFTLKRKVRQKTLEMSEAMYALLISERKYKDLVRNLNVGVVVFSPERKITIYNQAYLDLLGITEEMAASDEKTSRPWRFVNENGQETADEASPVNQVITRGYPIENYTLGIKRDDDADIVWVTVTAFPDYDDAGELQQIVMTMADITKNKEAESLLYEFSIHDSLTGLYNRDYFESLIDLLKTENLSTCGLVICDLDGLKLINDTLGHAIGDKYLLSAATILQASFRIEDTVARIGGDEFAVIMPDVTENQLRESLEKLSQSLEEYNNNIESIHLSISSGYAFKTGSNINLHEMYKEADDHMYQDKNHHRKSVKSNIIRD